MFHNVYPQIFREVAISVDDPNPMTSERNIILGLKPIYKLYLENAFLQNIIFSRTATKDA